jgi:hypothetical protein
MKSILLIGLCAITTVARAEIAPDSAPELYFTSLNSAQMIFVPQKLENEYRTKKAEIRRIEAGLAKDFPVTQFVQLVNVENVYVSSFTDPEEHRILTRITGFAITRTPTSNTSPLRAFEVEARGDKGDVLATFTGTKEDLVLAPGEHLVQELRFRHDFFEGKRRLFNLVRRAATVEMRVIGDGTAHAESILTPKRVARLLPVEPSAWQRCIDALTNF